MLGSLCTLHGAAALDPDAPSWFGLKDWTPLSKWSTTMVLLSQTIAVGIGTISPKVRWFMAINFSCRKKAKKYNKGSQHSPDTNLNNFVIHLDGEDELVDLMMKNNDDATAHWINICEKQKPKNFIELLEKVDSSLSFIGVKDFDSDKVPSLGFSEPPNCWALPKKSFGQRLNSMGWLEVDLNEMALQEKGIKETIKALSDISKENFTEYAETHFIHMNEWFLEEDPSRLCIRMLAANSMYRISCFTKLQHVISKQCRQSGIKEREQNIRNAVLLFGKTEGIIRILDKKKIQESNPGQLVHIDDWHLLCKKTDTISSISCSTDKESAMDIINQLAGMGIKLEDEIQGLWLLGTLPDTWETFRTSLSNSAPDGVITMKLAKGERQGRSKSRGPSNRGNHRSSSSKGKFADVECYHCHKKGHTMKFCKQLKKENKKKNYNNQKNKHKKAMNGVDSDFGVIRMGNTGLSRIAGIGDICLKFDTGMEFLRGRQGKELKCIRSDNGGEYIGPFDAYCREHGIQHQKTPPKTPQLNGLAERMNRTLVERVRCLLSHAGLPASSLGVRL
ncbi:G-type lectin S-receptor-like serine/threonine-protein kinase [Tanacetum coccineum]